MMLARAWVAAIGVLAVGSLAACSPDASPLILGAGPSGGTTSVCARDFAGPMAYGEPFRLTAGAGPVTLVRADLVGAFGVRVIEQDVTRAVLLKDGTHLGLGLMPVGEDVAWEGRIPLAGAVIRDDGGERWFVAFELQRTSAAAGGFKAVDLTYEVNGERHVVRGTESMSFPAAGGSCW